MYSHAFGKNMVLFFTCTLNPSHLTVTSSRPHRYLQNLSVTSRPRCYLQNPLTHSPDLSIPFSRPLCYLQTSLLSPRAFHLQRTSDRLQSFLYPSENLLHPFEACYLLPKLPTSLRGLQPPSEASNLLPKLVTSLRNFPPPSQARYLLPKLDTAPKALCRPAVTLTACLCGSPSLQPDFTRGP